MYRHVNNIKLCRNVIQVLIEIHNWRIKEVRMVLKNRGENTCGIQSKETHIGGTIFVGNSIWGHTRVAMGPCGVDLVEARENNPIIVFDYNKKGFRVAIKKQLKPMKMDFVL